ncbi:MAG: hypothetical protein SFY56_05590 [Bacteroidota bacterium]|nr:hypothetical protein [Bacteroidota bacterium]
MTKTEIILLIIAAFLLFKLIKELAYIRLYAFMLRLKAEGKLVPENDPNGIVDNMEKELKKNSNKYF